MDDAYSLSNKRTSVTDLSSLVNNNNGLNMSPGNNPKIGNSAYKRRTLSIAPSMQEAGDHLVTPKVSAKNLNALSPGMMREHPSSRTIDRARGGGGYLDRDNLQSLGGADL